MMNEKFDAVIVAPAYIEEGRSTIGAYQLLNGVPIERTQRALDPKAPITESYIPNILSKDLSEKFASLIDIIDFKTITKGAGPITLKLNELIQKGKRIIVTDAISVTDLEQDLQAHLTKKKILNKKKKILKFHLLQDLLYQALLRK